jgi:hypothetical protein
LRNVLSPSVIRSRMKAPESFDLIGFERYLGRGLDFDPLQRSLGTFAFEFERGEPIPEHIIESGDVVFHHLVEAAEFAIGLGDFRL